MSKLLTITIPTYNRAEMLDAQFGRILNDIKGFENDCDILVNDNCSTDNTREIVNKWQLTFNELGISFKNYRHDHNIGGMLNIIGSIHSATGTYVWTLGDDDEIAPGTLPYIVHLLKKYSGLSLIMLDGIGRDANTMEIKHERFFDSTSDKPMNGAPQFEHFLENAIGGVMFISAMIYKTVFVQEALASWPSSNKNLASQAYWVAFCAARGDFIVTPTLHTLCVMGIGFTDKDKHWFFKIKFTDVPEVYMRLMLAGYSRHFCYRNVTFNLKSLASYRVFIGGVRREFGFTIRAYLRYLRCVLMARRLYITLGSLEKIKEKM